jgi:hypothetical protein
MSTLPLPTPLADARADASANVSAIPLDASYLDRERMSDDGDREVIAGRKTILSIFPVELTRHIQHAGMSTYYHPAAQKDEIIQVVMNPRRMNVQRTDGTAPCFSVSRMPVPTGERGYLLLQCVDTFQWCKNYERDRQEPLPIYAHDVAQSLVQEWTQARRVNNGTIGMSLLDPGEPIRAQVDRLWATQTAYFRSLVLEADGFFASTIPSERASIGELHRIGAHWLGTENRPWFRLQEEVRMKTCPKCSERIIASAIGCKECSVFLPDFYAKYPKLWTGQDSAVGMFWEQTGTTPKGVTAAA